ncbi:hypothetical protein LU276_08230 [Moraxella haemolytica]|uniref:BRO-N domain-containing protein n=1 Tax=Moraxella haemolytica TaxID=2904119 RepID=UPI0025433A37|nr:BRO family protein [Moraxella sp. ZY171148]WII94987.1 hypothetical protein LU276_08230 [Moraxella sp. ZY171148]
MQTLTFQNITLTPAKVDNQIWLTSAELAKALGYSRSDEVNNLYNRKKDEFTANMTQTAEIQTKGGLQRVRIFSLRGCHLIAMFARTKVAKEFRQWVLDILDKEVGQPVQVKSTATDRTPLRQAVTALVAKYGLMHDEGYRLVHQYMGVNSIDEIPIDDLPEAVAYVHRLMLGTINDRELYDVLVSCAIHLKQFGTMLSSLHAHGYYADDDNPIDPATRCYNYLVRVVDKMNLRNIHGVPMFANNKINFYNGFSRPI